MMSDVTPSLGHWEFDVVSDLASAREDLTERIATAECVWLLGSGASEAICQKFAHSLRSIGFRAIALSAESVFHGDGGGVQPTDLVLWISRGAKQELLDQLESIFLDRVGDFFILTENRSVTPKAGKALVLPPTVEVDPLGLLPSVSVVGMLTALDSLLLGLVERIGISYGVEFSRSHPAGSLGTALGKRLSMISEIPYPSVIDHSTEPTVSMVELETKLSESLVGAVCVGAGGSNFLGIITDGDLRREIMRRGVRATFKLDEIANRDFTSISVDATLSEAIAVFSQNPAINVLPVRDEDGTVVRMLPARLIARALRGEH